MQPARFSDLKSTHVLHSSCHDKVCQTRQISPPKARALAHDQPSPIRPALPCLCAPARRRCSRLLHMRNRASCKHEEEEFVFPFDAQATATSARVPRTGIVVPLRRKRTGCGRGVSTVGRRSFLFFGNVGRSDVQASGGCCCLQFFEIPQSFCRFSSVLLSFFVLLLWKRGAGRFFGAMVWVSRFCRCTLT